MKHLLAFLMILLSYFGNSQTCENFDRNLFHMLDKQVTNKINCKDSQGLKQGWWINYSTSYNSTYKPDELDTGIYVGSYIYGKYENSKRIGTWKTINNVHLIYALRTTDYYYSKDTILVTASFLDGGINKSRIYYNADSTIIHSSSYLVNGDTLNIKCEKNNSPNSCLITYRDNLIKSFPKENFEIELYKTFSDYIREKRIINEKNR